MRASFVPSSLLLALLAPAFGCLGEPSDPVVDAGPAYAGIQSVVALAGADLEVLEGSRVQLDGHASRSLLEDGDLLLTWSQVAGPPVVLTNPSSPSPAFVAPLAPATLVFRLRAESGDGVALDEVSVVVREESGAPPFFVEVPRDVGVNSGEPVTFPATVVGASGGVTIEAHARCDGDVRVEVDGGAVTVFDTRELPCLVFVDAVDADGRRAAPAARVLWPRGVPLPPETRLTAPVVVEPGAGVTIAFDGARGEGQSVAWPAGGSSDGLMAAHEGVEVPLSAPRKRTRLVVGGTRRLGPASGGVRYAVLDVTAGAGNRAPTADGGDDRGVPPGAAFTLTTSGSSDLDDDPLTVEVTQVIGPAAGSDGLVPGLFHAPDAPDVLLFHVTAFDGTVYSDPDSVRVVVDAAVANQAPVLDVEPTRWVAPGTVFRVDASAAYDPDSGFIERYTIAQDPSDPVQLLDVPVEEPFIDLTAGADGEVYRFRLSAFDEHGQGASADLEVIVERAGPYVDAATGSDEEGDGTATAPFATLAAALEVAARHQLPELRVASGAQAPFAGTLAGIEVVGGYLRDGETWTPGGAPSRLPLAAGGVIVDNAALSQVALELGAVDSALTLQGVSALASVTLSEGPVHQGPLVDVAAGATVALSDVVATASAPSSSGGATLVRVRPGAALRVNGSSLTGGSGGTRVGLSCEAATVDVIGSELVAAVSATEATGIAASSCDIQLLDSRISGGAAQERATGIAADDTLLYVAPTSLVSGAATGSSARASALLLEGGDTPVVLVGTLVAVEEGAYANVALGVDAGSSRVALVDGIVTAHGSEAATALLARAGDAQVSGASLEATAPLGDAVALDLVGDEVVVTDSRLTASGARAFGVRAAAPEGVLAPRLDGVVVEVAGVERGAGLGLGSSRAVLATAVDVTVRVTDPSGSARGLGLRDGNVSDSVFSVVGSGETLGVVVATGGSGASLERCAVMASSDAGSAVGLLAGAQTSVASSFLRATSATSAIGVDARAALVARHATLWADGTALLASASAAVVDVANTLLIGDAGFEQRSGAPAPALATHLAIVAARPWVDELGAIAITEPELEAAGCSSCLLLADPLIDDTGHLSDAEPHPLVNAGAAEHAVERDLDGDVIPAGALPDIGCDERAPPTP